MIETITKENTQSIEIKRSVKTFNEFGLNLLESVKDYLPKEKIFNTDLKQEDYEKI